MFTYLLKFLKSSTMTFQFIWISCGTRFKCNVSQDSVKSWQKLNQSPDSTAALVFAPDPALWTLARGWPTSSIVKDSLKTLITWNRGQAVFLFPFFFTLQQYFIQLSPPKEINYASLSCQTDATLRNPVTWASAAVSISHGAGWRRSAGRKKRCSEGVTKWRRQQTQAQLVH